MIKSEIKKHLFGYDVFKDIWRSYRIIYHNNWVPAFFAYPFDLMNFIVRRILLNLKPIPKWHEDVIRKNKMDKERPGEISYKDNFEFKMFEMKDK